MQIAINDEDVDEFIGIINRIAQEHPILVDKYLVGKEIEVDAVCDGDRHPDPGYHGAYRARRHPFRRQYLRISGTEHFCERSKRTIEDYTRKLAKALHVIGLINIQFIVMRR